MITTIRLINPFIPSHNYHSFSGDTFKIQSLSDFQVYNTVLLIIVSMLYVRSPELIHLRVRHSSALTNIAPFPSPLNTQQPPFYSYFHEFGFFRFYISYTIFGFLCLTYFTIFCQDYLCPSVCVSLVLSNSLQPHGASSVHEIFQVRILEWTVISFSTGSPQPRDLCPKQPYIEVLFACLYVSESAQTPTDDLLLIPLLVPLTYQFRLPKSRLQNSIRYTRDLLEKCL